MSEVKGFKLVPASMLLDKETIGVINFHCGDGADGQFGEYSDGHLWVGTVTDDDGKEVYGLHLSTAEYPEEGSSTLIEFDQPEDAAQSEMAALREELDVKKDRVFASRLERDELRQKLTAAEQRNAETSASLQLATRLLASGLSALNPRAGLAKNVRAFLESQRKPTESGASE